MDLGIRGKVALVVGASRSMGRAVAEELLVEGCRVLCVARSADVPGEGLALDLMGAGAVDRLVAWVGDRNPGIIYHALGGSVDGIRDTFSKSEDWAKVWRFNLGIAIDINNAFLPGMVARKWGRIVHTSSDGIKNSIGNAPYTSSKFAVEGYVKVASKQFSKDNVIISAVSPGQIYTEGRFVFSQSPEWTQEYFDKYLPARRFGTAQEVAKVVAFLCSEHSAFMPGAIVNIDGASR